MSKVQTRIEPLHNPKHGKHWCKLVERVDESKSNGFAFIGEWVRTGSQVEVPAGAIVLCCDEDQSSSGRFRGRTIRVLTITERGQAEIESFYTKDRGWALQIRDKIAAMLPEHSRYRVTLSDRQLQIVSRVFDAGRHFARNDEDCSDTELEAIERALREAEAIT